MCLMPGLKFSPDDTPDFMEKSCRLSNSTFLNIILMYDGHLYFKKLIKVLADKCLHHNREHASGQHHKGKERRAMISQTHSLETEHRNLTVMHCTAHCEHYLLLQLYIYY